jgi:hypothetical protein
MELWPVTALALIGLTAYDFMFGKEMKRRWIMTAAFWVLFSILILSTPSCRYGGGEVEGPDIPYSF